MPPKKTARSVVEPSIADEATTAAPPTKKQRQEKPPVKEVQKSDTTAASQVDTSSSASEPLGRKRSSSSSEAAAVTEESVLKGTIPFVRKTKNPDFKPNSELKIISWNVAGLRALLKKDGDQLSTLIKRETPDVLCLQETKLSDLAEAAKIGVIPGYTFVDSVSTAKKGYSGTRTYVRDGLHATHQGGFDVLSKDKGKDDEEGRVLTTFLDGGKLAILNSYVPNSGMVLDRLEYRTETYDPMVRALLGDLHKRVGSGGAVVWTGDLNVAERDYDRFFASNWKAMQKVPGFTPEERVSFRKTLSETHMVDSFRHLYPNAHKAYSFWSARFQCRQKGNGWRLDYFVVSSSIADRIVDSFMLPEYTDSDHCPIVLWLKKG